MKRQSRETRRYEKKRENDNIKIISNIQLPFQEPIHNSTHIGQPTPPQQNNKKKWKRLKRENMKIQNHKLHTIPIQERKKKTHETTYQGEGKQPTQLE